MIEAIVRWSNAHPRTVLLLVVLMATTGLFAAGRLEFDALPDVTGKQVVILTRAPGYTPEEVERLVTRPVEIAIAGVPGLVRQRSTSRYGISSVTAIFDERTDLVRARQLVQERLQGLSDGWPPGVAAPELGPLTGGLGEIYQFTVTSSKRTPVELYELVQLRLVPLIASTPGVVEVNAWGGGRRTLDVVGDPVAMSRHGMTLADLAEATRAAAQQAAGATIEAGDRSVLLRGVAWPRRADELASAVVRRTGHGAAIRIGDVARIEEAAMPRIGTATADGEGEAVYVMVQMLVGENALAVLDELERRMDDVRRVLPADVDVRVVYDRGDLVKATLRTVFTNLAEGGALVVVVLFAMLGSLRAGLLVASIIPLSMLGAVVGMTVLDVPGNLMSLGALDFGLLVDGGIVMVEATFHAMERHGGPVRTRVREQTVRMARPVFYGVLIILLVYVPVFALTDVEGKMFHPMALTVVLALATSLLLSITYVPAASTIFLRPHDAPAEAPRLAAATARLYHPVLDWSLAHPRWVAAGALAALMAAAWLFATAGTTFLPQLDEGDLVIQTTRNPDIHVSAAVREDTRLERALRENVPEVRYVATRTGSPAVATDLMGLEQSDVFVDLAPREQWRPGLDRDALIERIADVVRSVAPEAEVGFTQPIQMRFNELVGGSVTDVTLSFFGEDLTALRTLAERARDIVAEVPGAEDVRVLAPPEVPSIDVRPRPLDAARVGLRNEDVLDHVAALRRGLEVAVTYDGPIRVPIRVRLDGATDALTLEATPVPTADGRWVPLGHVADVVRAERPALVDHEMAQRRIVVGFNVRERDLGTVVAEAKARIDTELVLGDGIRTVWGGQFDSLRRARERLAVIVPAVLACIFVLLLVLVRSLRPVLVVMLAVPFALVGGIVALRLRGLPISVSAAVGFIALSGIAVLNGVVLVKALMETQASGADPRRAAREAGRSRMRAVSTTALVAALGFVPMMLATGVGAEVQRPLATVVVGGIVSSTLLTLCVVPTIFAWTTRQAVSVRPSTQDAPS
ncbi:MAG: efflux RND transporter permease subunit [Deltaproteobacteria bacterium]|nr:MAG: efflux RND transporter permease subunit [Deltaproteobacteria bacterium]